MASAPAIADLPSVPAPDFPGVARPIETRAELVTDSQPEKTGVASLDPRPSASPWGAASSPWGATPSVDHGAASSVWDRKSAPPKLTDIMSEELAAQLADEEENKIKTREKEEEEEEDLKLAMELSKEEAKRTTAAAASSATDSDLLLAQMLQLEFDKEYDADLSRRENHVNRNSKVTLSYRNFTPLHPVEKEMEANCDLDLEVREEKLKIPNLRFTGITPGKGKSKHDIETGNKRNADRVMNFPPEFETGDADAIEMRLPNSVYNDLKVYSHKELKVSQKVRDKVDQSTAEMALDPRTRLLLYKLVNSGVVSEVHGTISTGKESVVIYAKGGSVKERAIPSECAIKVFKTSLNEFKRREEYMKGDHRLPAQGYKKQNPRKIIRLWAEKEMHNLSRLRRSGVPCPEVVSLKKHVLVMSFIGADRQAAPKLKDAALSATQLEAAHAQTVRAMKTMFETAGLVHADLSEYNLLWHASHVWLIDVSQSVELIHPNALEFLFRDCVNVSKFFKRQGLHSTQTPEQLFNHVTDLGVEGVGADFARRVVDVQQSEEFVGKFHGPLAKHQRLVDKELTFDYFFEKAKKERRKEKREKERKEEEETESEDSEEEEEEEEEGK